MKDANGSAATGPLVCFGFHGPPLPAEPRELVYTHHHCLFLLSLYWVLGFLSSSTERNAYSERCPRTHYFISVTQPAAPSLFEMPGESLLEAAIHAGASQNASSTGECGWFKDTVEVNLTNLEVCCRSLSSSQE